MCVILYFYNSDNYTDYLSEYIPGILLKSCERSKTNTKINI